MEKRDYLKEFEQRQIAHLYEECKDEVRRYEDLCRLLKRLIEFYIGDTSNNIKFEFIGFAKNKIFVDYAYYSYGTRTICKVSFPIEWLYFLCTDKEKLQQLIEEKKEKDKKEAEEHRKQREEEKKKVEEEKERKEYERLKAKFGE